MLTGLTKKQTNKKTKHTNQKKQEKKQQGTRIKSFGGDGYHFDRHDVIIVVASVQIHLSVYIKTYNFYILTMPH